ncbi:flavin reductase family protein [Vibrio maerlii]|uniref:flavin reductase family protein n=1 Tax=Vibrio maerlii TaxID=2231648 RepID=UPI000E3D49D9|nr:flavin reductase [Vibrio maerlii]
MDYTEEIIASMDSRRRARFINSLSGFKSANLIGTLDKEGNENLSIVSSVFHLGANPALMGFIIRPASVERHTLDNILETKAYSINSVCTDFIASAHQTSARYSKCVSEFEAVGLTPFYKGKKGPFVLESSIKIWLELVSHQTLEVNSTELIIGEIKLVMVNEGAVMPDGFIDIEALDVATVSGLDSYHMTQRIGRLNYAKPGHRLFPLTREGEPSSWKAIGLKNEQGEVE